ncbi:DNA-binding response regulator [Actinomyces sp. 2119]|uniref:DNA-binding response regulator n=1 Tax=Actinomyces lilanjuaniae TaxID=2321394 RepID=A0ABM6Z4W1_9ACTO|nr:MULTISPECIES: LytTR family DNA-binding domain-containing protein [Actinomyces]AYD89959.1 DNA-binding response regulator [Actinomyces lilanjuaniae]RJF42440.1 DNA-binding response regulator [Actinomyces sp. 2119]
MVHVGVVEDDPLHLRTLTGYLERYAAQRQVHLEVTTYPSASALLESYRPVYDILLLDIRMEGAQSGDVDGMSAARTVRATDPAVVIIFVTSAHQYAVAGYEVGALGYLLKPLTYTALAQEMGRALAALGRQGVGPVLLPEGSGVRRVSARDIVYLESVRHRVRIHLLDQEVTVASSLKAMEEVLRGHSFYRSNSCYLVNLDHVVGVHDQDCLMSTGEVLRVSRPRRRGLMSALADHVGGLPVSGRPPGEAARTSRAST